MAVKKIKLSNLKLDKQKVKVLGKKGMTNIKGGNLGLSSLDDANQAKSDRLCKGGCGAFSGW